MHTFRLAFASGLAALSLGGQAATVAEGTLSDALEGSSADLASASVRVDDDQQIWLSVSFGPSSTLSTATAVFNLDLDRNPATGMPGVTTLGTDAALIGVDYAVRIYASSFEANAIVLAFAADGSYLGTVATWAASYVGNVFSTGGSLADLGGDDGLMTFKLTSSRQTGFGLSTGVLDVMSDAGLPVGSVSAVPEPSAWALFGAGALVLAGLKRRRRGAG